MTDPLLAAERTAILDGLESSDGELRRLAVEQLLRLPFEEAARHLVAKLGDDVWRVRKAAVERIVRLRDHLPVQDMLVDSLADGENPGRRNSAFEALVGCGARVTARLVEEIGNRDVDVRKLVIDALAAIGDPVAREPLSAAIADEDPNVRAAAAEALGVVGGDREISDLLRVAVEPEEDILVRLSSLRALARMEAEVAAASLGDTLDDSLLRPAAFELLGLSEDPAAIDLLIKGLGCGSRAGREAAMAAILRCLGRLDGAEALALCDRLRDCAASNEKIVEVGCERLEGADLPTRMVLVQFLGLLDDPRVVLPMLAVGRDEALQELADHTLEGFGSLLPAALEANWGDLDLDLKRRACAVLGRIGHPRCEALLVDGLGASDPDLRSRAAAALAEGGFFGRLPDLVRSLESAAAGEDDGGEEVEGLVAAIVELAQRSESSQSGIDVHVIEVLASRLGGAPEPVRLAIARVLAELGREQDQDVLGYLQRDESAQVRRAAVRALARFDFETSRDAIRLALGDESATVRIAAAGVLGEAEDGRASAELAALMIDEEPRVMAVAVRAVGRLHRRLGGSLHEAYALLGPALEGEAIVALAGLEALLEVGGTPAGQLAFSALEHSESEVVRAAIACVGAHGEPPLLESLFELVAHEDWSVRAEAVQVLADRAFPKALPVLLRRLDKEEDPFVREAVLRAIRRLEG